MRALRWLSTRCAPHNIGDHEPPSWYYTNKAGTGCFGYNLDGTVENTLTLDGLLPQTPGDTKSVMSAAVTCTPEDATGDQGSAVPISNANKPGNAILTLSTGSEDGFSFRTNGPAGAFRVRGGVWSNSNIVRDNNGNLESTESIRAHSGCAPESAMVAPVVNCGAGTVADPNYPSDLELAGTGSRPCRPHRRTATAAPSPSSPATTTTWRSSTH